MFKRPKGTRDFYPEEMRLRNWLFDHFYTAARLHGFEEYDSPILESEELYTRKQGEEITAQLYSFEDKGGRRVTLRPEMTPSLARMVLERATALPMPLKWFSLPQCWRYERMQRGRMREHYQWNMDVWGVEGASAEVELLAALCGFFAGVGLGPHDVRIRVNDRRVLGSVLAGVGVSEAQFAPVCIIVDKMDRLPREVIEEQLAELGLDGSVITVIQETLSIGDLDALEDALGADSEVVAELRALWALAEGYGISEWLDFDAGIVRGLAYYTGVVFEAVDAAGELRAICGGGRYDTLLSTFGGRDVPACGFGFGDVVIMELLAERGLIPDLPGGIDDVVFAFSEELRGAAMQAAAALRAKGRSVDLVLEPKKLKWAFKHAERCGAARLVMLTPKEWESEKVRVKDLASGEESDLTLDEL